MAYTRKLIVLTGVISVELKPSFKGGKENISEVSIFPHLHFPGLSVHLPICSEHRGSRQKLA